MGAGQRSPSVIVVVLAVEELYVTEAGERSKLLAAREATDNRMMTTKKALPRSFILHN